jgi:superfamily II RNA helicase
VRLPQVRSFHQFQSNRNAPKLIEQVEKLQAEKEVKL